MRISVGDEIKEIKEYIQFREEWLAECRRFYARFKQDGNQYGMEVMRESGELAKQQIGEFMQKISMLMMGLRP